MIELDKNAGQHTRMASSQKLCFGFCVASIFLMIAATDFYLPGLPLLVREFNSTPNVAQYTVASYLTLLALTALMFGPLADRYGRRKIFLLGFFIFNFGSLLCAFSTSIQALIFFRAVQGIGAGSISVLALVLIYDIFSPKEVAKKMAQASLAIVFAPGFGQIVGGHLMDHCGWTSAFFLTTFLGFLLMGGIFSFLPETSSLSAPPQPLSQVFHNYGRIFSHGRAMAVFLTMPILFAGLWAFRTVTPFLFIDHWGVPLPTFGYYMFGLVGAHFVGGFYTQTFVQQLGVEKVMSQGVTLGLIGVGVLGGLCAVGLDTPTTLILCMLPYATAISLTISTSVSKGMSYFPQMGGTASATFTFLRMGAAALGGYVGGFLEDRSPYQLVIFLGVCAGASYFLTWWSRCSGPPGSEVQ